MEATGTRVRDTRCRPLAGNGGSHLEPARGPRHLAAGGGGGAGANYNNTPRILIAGEIAIHCVATDSLICTVYIDTGAPDTAQQPDTSGTPVSTDTGSTPRARLTARHCPTPPTLQHFRAQTPMLPSKARTPRPVLNGVAVA